MANWMKRNGVHGYVNTSENGYVGLSEAGHSDLFQAEHPGPRGAGGNYTQYSPRPGQMVQSGSVSPRVPQPQQVQYSNQGQRNTDQKRKMGVLGTPQASTPAPTAPPVRSTASPLPSIQAQGPATEMNSKEKTYKNPTATPPVAAVRRSGGGGSRSASRPINEANLNAPRGQVAGGVEDSATRTSRATTPGTQSNADRAAAFGRSAVVRAGWDGQAAGMSRPGTNSTEVGRGTTLSQVSDWVRAGTPGRDHVGDLLFSPIRTIGNAISGRETAGQAAEQRAELTQGARTHRANHQAAGWARGAASIGLDVAETALTASGASSLAGGAARMLPRVAAAGGARRVLGALAGEVGTAATNAVAENGLRATARTAATNTARWAAPHVGRAVAAGAGGETVRRGVTAIGDSDNPESARVWGATGRDAGATAAIGLLSGMYGRAPRPAASRGLPSGGASPRGLPSGGGGSPPVSRAASSGSAAPAALVSPPPMRPTVRVPATAASSRSTRSVMARTTGVGRFPLETKPGPGGYLPGTMQNPRGHTPQGIRRAPGSALLDIDAPAPRGARPTPADTSARPLENSGGGMRRAAGISNAAPETAPAPTPAASTTPAPSPRKTRSAVPTPSAFEANVLPHADNRWRGQNNFDRSPTSEWLTQDLESLRPSSGGVTRWEGRSTPGGESVPGMSASEARRTGPRPTPATPSTDEWGWQGRTYDRPRGVPASSALPPQEAAPVSMSATDVTDRVSAMIDAPVAPVASALTPAQKGAATRAANRAAGRVSGKTIIGDTPGRGRDWRKGQTGPAGGAKHPFLGGISHGMVSSSPGGGMSRGGENPPQPSTNHGFGRSNVRI